MAASTANIVKKQFEDVSREYYAWEQIYCSEKIASLCVPTPVVGSITDFNVHLDAPRETHPETSSVSTAGQEALFARYIVHDNGTSEADLVHADVINIIATPPTPYPSYESCTPTSRNILHGDDPPAMPFLPFADDPSFNPTDYMLEHTRLAWQEGYRDTDSTWRSSSFSPYRGALLTSQHSARDRTRDRAPLACWARHVDSGDR